MLRTQGAMWCNSAVATLVLWLRQDASGDSTTPVSVKVPVSALDLLMSLAQLGLMLGYIYTCDRYTVALESEDSFMTMSIVS